MKSTNATASAPVFAGRTLTVDHVTKRFGGVTAVDDVSFKVASGEAIAVIGPNGAGKTSLLKLLSGVYLPNEGRVTFGDVAIGDLVPHHVARHGIGLAHQIPQPFKGLTVRENVAIGAMARPGRQPARRRDAFVTGVLDTCGLRAKADDRASSLRLLDLKRLELARALSVDPGLILLDEVAAGLNGRDLEDVIELIRTIHAQGRSIVLVEHVEGVVASLVERVIVIDWGKVIAEGTPADVAANPKVREVYLGGGHARSSSATAAQPGRDAASVPLLQASSLTTSYGPIVALRDVSIDVDAGEIVAVLGANGAGKSTLAGTVSGLVKPEAGRVTLAGIDITGQPRSPAIASASRTAPRGERSSRT